MATSPKRLSIILPSYNDARIAETIRSVRAFDDLGTVRLVVIDGASKPEIVSIIRPLLAEDDYFVSERDKGIFDALNKGLDACNTEFIGWIGSDDLFTGRVRSNRVVRALEDHDLFVTSLAIFRDNAVRRVSHALPSKLGLVKYGINNPHYATFGRASLFKSERFRLDLLAADGEYFLKMFKKEPRITIDNSVAVLAREGGFSTASYSRTYQQHRQLLKVYAEHTNLLMALLALGLRGGYKLSNSLYYRIVRTDPVSLLTFGGVLGRPESPR